MKKHILLFLILISSTKIYAQWDELTAHPNIITVWTTYFINDSTGFIAGDTQDTIGTQITHYNLVLKTSNWGQTWDTVSYAYLGATASFFKATSIFFTTPLIGYIAGESQNARILRTYDGGNTWQFLPLPQITSQSFFTKILFTDTLIGYLCTNYKFYKTTDGGDNWSQVYNIGSNDFSFPSANVGYFYGFKTADAGNNWTTTSYLPIYPLAVDFINDSVGIIAGQSQNSSTTFGSLIRTTDGAQTWTRQDFDMELSDFRDLQFVNDTSGYLIGGGSPNYKPFWKTNNAGLNWYQQTVNHTGAYTGSPWCLHCPSPNVCYAGCYGSNKVYRTKNGGGPLIGVGINETTATAVPLVVPNPANETISLKNIQPNTLITITNITGNIVLQTTLNQSNQINISHLTSGIYFIKAQSKQTLQIAKFIKE